VTATKGQREAKIVGKKTDESASKKNLLLHRRLRQVVLKKSSISMRHFLIFFNDSYSLICVDDLPSFPESWIKRQRR
jgi:hypothetical protein